MRFPQIRVIFFNVILIVGNTNAQRLQLFGHIAHGHFTVWIQYLQNNKGFLL